MKAKKEGVVKVLFFSEIQEILMGWSRQYFEMGELFDRTDAYKTGEILHNLAMLETEVSINVDIKIVKFLRHVAEKRNGLAERMRSTLDEDFYKAQKSESEIMIMWLDIFDTKDSAVDVLLVMNEQVSDVLEAWALDFDEAAMIYGDQKLVVKAEYFRSLKEISTKDGTHVNRRSLDTLLQEATRNSKSVLARPLIPRQVAIAFKKEASILLQWLESHGVTPEKKAA